MVFSSAHLLIPSTVVFTNVVPYGPRQIWDLWEKVETAIYAGLEK